MEAIQVITHKMVISSEYNRYDYLVHGFRDIEKELMESSSFMIPYDILHLCITRIIKYVAFSKFK